MATKIYQIQLTLKGSKPKIWRRLLIPADFTLSDLHKIIQTAMGWTNSHLHQFINNNTFYSVKDPDDDMSDDMDTIDYEEENTRISDLLVAEKGKIIYEYDFGDGWEHDLLLENILPIDSELKYPLCITGKMNCPPEDCGGVWGYTHILEIMKQPDHEEYEDTKEWLGDHFDPEYFNSDEINELLREKDYGCFNL